MTSGGFVRPRRRFRRVLLRPRCLALRIRGVGSEDTSAGGHAPTSRVVSDDVRRDLACRAYPNVGAAAAAAAADTNCAPPVNSERGEGSWSGSSRESGGPRDRRCASGGPAGDAEPSACGTDSFRMCFTLASSDKTKRHAGVRFCVSVPFYVAFLR